MPFTDYSLLKGIALRYLMTVVLVLMAGWVVAEPPSVTEQLSGKVVRIADGDTITVLVNKEEVRVRLEGIDAPESGQSFGNKAKLALAEMVAGKTVTVHKTGTDKYKRTLGTVYVDGVDANAKLIEGGWAWHFKKYSTDAQLAKLEETARADKRGLWADRNALAPWDYRARQKMPQPAMNVSGAPATAYWLNSSSGVRHNQRCEHFNNTKHGRFCKSDEGRPCGICGG